MDINGIKTDGRYTDIMSASLEENMKYLNQRLAVDKNFDLVYRVIKVGERNACIYFIDGFCKDELMQNWELAKDEKPLNRINPLVQIGGVDMSEYFPEVVQAEPPFLLSVYFPLWYG